LLQAARDLRKTMTDAEQLLWQCLRGKQLDGFKFRRQHPIDRFVLDFYCPAARLAVELDGSQHNTEQGRAADAERTAWLNARGIRVLRFWNSEVFSNLEGVLTAIWEALHAHDRVGPHPSPDVDPHPSPPPLGEGAILLPPEGGGREGGHTTPLRDGGTGATAYAEAVGVYLAFAINKVADRGCSLGRWDPTPTQSGIINAFSRQALPMTWDFAESNPLGVASGNILGACDLVAKALLCAAAKPQGTAIQADASSQSISADKIISTDPPYYDNIGYADLSDFFYVWLRRSLRPVFPDLFATLAVPKAEELVATPYRHGSKEKAEQFFLDGMTQAMHRLAEQAHPAFPVTIYYAFKQQETLGTRSDTRLGTRTSGPHEQDADETSLGARSSGPHEQVADETSAHPATTSTGWETFLDAVIRAGFAISGTWPMRTEYTGNLKKNVSALASSIVLVCRPRPADAPTATRREFVQALKAELPAALAELQKANIAPVDLAQAAIGPGMAVYTRYARVLDAEGRPVSVREALALINRTLDEVLAEQEGDFDADTRWALAWFEQHGFAEGEYGVAETLSKAKNTSVAGLADAGILESKRGKVRLLRPEELPADWDPATDARLTAWETVHHLIRVLESGGESAAAELVAKLGTKAETARELAYRLYTICERKKRAAEALSYNALVQSWPEIVRLAREGGAARPAQETLFEDTEA
jgi:putative DNA methylase